MEMFHKSHGCKNSIDSRYQCPSGPISRILGTILISRVNEYVYRYRNVPFWMNFDKGVTSLIQFEYKYSNFVTSLSESLLLDSIK